MQRPACTHSALLSLSFFSPFTLCKCANLFPFSFSSFSSFVAAIDFCALADSLSFGHAYLSDCCCCYSCCFCCCFIFCLLQCCSSVAIAAAAAAAAAAVVAVCWLTANDSKLVLCFVYHHHHQADDRLCNVCLCVFVYVCSLLGYSAF